MREQLVSAIEQRRVVTFTYRGQPRRVQPAAFGVGGRHHRETLHGYQVGGGSERGGIPDWRNFNVAAIESLTVTDETFSTPPGYSRPWIGEIVSALPSSGTGTGGAGDGDGGKAAAPNLGGIPINPETAAKAADAAAKAAEAAGQALGKLGKWFRSR